MTDRDASTSPVSQVKEVVERAQRSRPARVMQRYASSNGALLGAGMAYQSIFALFAAVWVGFSIAGIWVRSDPLLYSEVIRLANRAVPNLIGSHGAISTELLTTASRTLSITGIIALVGLVWTALGWLSSTRTAIRAIFGVGNDTRNFFVQRSIDALQALAFGVGLIAAALVSVLTNQLLTQILGALGLASDAAGVTTYVVSVVVTLLINFGTLAGMYRVLSHLYIPWRSLLMGSALGAVALSVLSQASSLLLRGATRNPLLASFAVFVGLLLWFNFVCQVILIAAAWIAVGMEDHGVSARRLSPEQQQEEAQRERQRSELEAARNAVREASAAYERTRGWMQRRRARKRLLQTLRVLQGMSARDPGPGD